MQAGAKLSRQRVCSRGPLDKFGIHRLLQQEICDAEILDLHEHFAQKISQPVRPIGDRARDARERTVHRHRPARREHGRRRDRPAHSSTPHILRRIRRPQHREDFVARIKHHRLSPRPLARKLRKPRQQRRKNPSDRLLPTPRQ